MSPPVEYQKKIAKNLAWEIFDQIHPLLRQGQVDEAFAVLRRRGVGPKTIYGTNGRVFCKLIIDYANEETGALKAAYLKLMRGLIDAGVDVDRQDRYGQTLLSEALWSRDVDVCRLLLERGASPNLPVNEYGETPLYYAFKAFDANDPPRPQIAARLLEALILAGADVDVPLVSRRSVATLEHGTPRLKTARQFVESLPEDDLRRRTLFAALEKRDAANQPTKN
ncbi:MAG: ankyrin repeat domain-containing protein [Thermoguttaceae bacterium]|nr:ankyrin repeat domain-containing protein [Thermoguttaceae bacterium]